MNPARNISFNVLSSIVLVLIFGTQSVAQTQDTSILKNIPPPELGPNDTILVSAKIVDHELVPAGTLDWYWVKAPYPKELLKRRQEWNRLRNAIYVTLPYAKRAGAILNDINAKLRGVEDKDERKKIIKSREAELKKEFTQPLSDLSIYQGKVLMKLINRQTGNNCYEIIKEYKGGLTARFYQTVAFFFNSSLKQPYNANGDEREMEIIVQEVERMYRL
ncbi:DUF4294 domain-containing protein [Pseudoflavitalea sp. G-6-1-2]|uniref:DUF4294 domain-containing protein n=1 Tax=Pseudoflavitalea sp. G-6-1-2 TaxID=2728841 RepID=UPI00146D20FE|nr:DUF4294 domain-containing protein [Pseudoflavitalea sp. G-6-1-2]NML23719.1 DUF4294 domain-containing protein [Pseudoflavitalea sp. G-6-1-2]